MEPVKIGISCGDVNGIGTEILIKTVSDNRIFRNANLIYYGSSKVLLHYKKSLEMERFNFNVLKGKDSINQKALNVVECLDENIEIDPGKMTEKAGEYALVALDKCLEHLKAGKIDCLITLPLNKSTIPSEGNKFKGHTEYITSYFEVDESLMILSSESVKVALVTNHESIKDVAEKITTDLVFNKIKILDNSLRRDFMINKPKIAVMGLNPHAGDNNRIGKEDFDIILPGVNKAKDAGFLTFGPYAADGFFGSGAYSKFDAVLAMYHDQGLIPFKTISFGSGVNFTAGLPIVRTSPDHGTAYDLVGTDTASNNSLINAIFLAADVAENRLQFDEIHSNPLKLTNRKKERI